MSALVKWGAPGRTSLDSFNVLKLNTEVNLMKNTTQFGTVIGITALIIGTPSFAGDHGSYHSGAQTQAAVETMTASRADIITTATNAGDFKTLLTAIKAAELTDVLKGEGPFTVFAPTDAAFAQLPKGTVESLLNDKQKLTQVLTYHVVPGVVTADQVTKLSAAKTLEGQNVTIAGKDGVTINGAKVVQADVLASNGIIHVIDQVLLPPAATESGGD